MYFGGKNYDYWRGCNSIWKLIRHNFIGMTRNERKVAIFLLSMYETSHSAFEENTLPGARVSVCISVLSRITDLKQSSVRKAIDGLIEKGVIACSEPHFSFSNISAFYRNRNNERQSLPEKVRQIILSIGRCLHCGSSERLTVDHIVPIKLGGGDNISNLQCLCLSCNCSKRDRFIG